jgi:hypothetical protein
MPDGGFQEEGHKREVKNLTGDYWNIRDKISKRNGLTNFYD